jgi:hypothetical protein
MGLIILAVCVEMRSGWQSSQWNMRSIPNGCQQAKQYQHRLRSKNGFIFIGENHGGSDRQDDVALAVLYARA